MTTTATNRLLFGCAYYDEYMPYDRLDQDIAMMKAANINVLRIAESTWSTEEPQPGVFDFSHVDRVLDATEHAGISVIIGTPTYAVPSWLVRLDPDVLADTPNGKRGYGPRQIMDITNGTYRYYGERIIRKLIAHVADRPNVIGYQVDNETKYYDVVSPNVQQMFVRHVRELFHGDLDALNREWGLDYWSNRIDSWEDFPDPTNSINGSMRGEFDAFRRGLVTEFLGWQAAIVREYARDDQFVTQNFDFGWKDGTFGLQPAVDHFGAAEPLDIAGMDVYFPTQDRLEGNRIAFAGDLTRGAQGRAQLSDAGDRGPGQHGLAAVPGPAAAAGVQHAGVRRGFGDVLALALHAQLVGDLLERHPVARFRARPHLPGCGGDRRGAGQARRATAASAQDEPRGRGGEQSLAHGAGSVQSGGRIPARRVSDRLQRRAALYV